MAYECYYTQKDQIMLILGTTHTKYHQKLTNWAKEELQDNKIPFDLEPPNIGLMLTRWAKELGLDYVPNMMDMANTIQTEDKHPTCTGCGMWGHTIDDCHIFVNYVHTKNMLN